MTIVFPGAPQSSEWDNKPTRTGVLKGSKRSVSCDTWNASPSGLTAQMWHQHRSQSLPLASDGHVGNDADSYSHPGWPIFPSSSLPLLHDWSIQSTVPTSWANSIKTGPVSRTSSFSSGFGGAPSSVLHHHQPVSRSDLSHIKSLDDTPLTYSSASSSSAALASLSHSPSISSKMWNSQNNNQPRRHQHGSALKMSNAWKKTPKVKSPNVVRFLEPISPLEDDDLDVAILKFLLSQDKFGIFTLSERLFEFSLDFILNQLNISSLNYHGHHHGSGMIGHSHRRRHHSKHQSANSSPILLYQNRFVEELRSKLRRLVPNDDLQERETGNDLVMTARRTRRSGSRSRRTSGEEDEESQIEEYFHHISTQMAPAGSLNRLVDQLEPRQLHRARLDYSTSLDDPATDHQPGFLTSLQEPQSHFHQDQDQLVDKMFNLIYSGFCFIQNSLLEENPQRNESERFDDINDTNVNSDQSNPNESESPNSKDTTSALLNDEIEIEQPDWFGFKISNQIIFSPVDFL